MVRFGSLGWLSLAGALSAALLPACGEDEGRRRSHDDAGEGGEGDAGSSGAGRGGSAGGVAGNAAHAGSGAGGSGASSGAGASGNGASGGSESDGGSSATAGNGAAGSDAGGSDAGGGESGSGAGGEGAETAGGSSGSAGMSGAGGVAAGGTGGAGAGSGGAGGMAGAGGTQPGLTCRTVMFDVKSYLICPHAGLDWAAARDYCLDLGADLISIETQDEDTWAFTEVIETGSIWTSANDLESEGDWRWGTGAALADGYQNWVPDQPNDAELGEDCAVLHSGGGDWNDVACSETIFTDPISFICEPP